MAYKSVGRSIINYAAPVRRTNLRDTPKRRMKKTLFTRHRNTVEPIMVANDRKATLRAIHTRAINQAINRQEVNVRLDDRPPLINNSEKELTRKERSNLAQLRSGHYRLLGSYKCRINKDAGFNVCTDCGRTPIDAIARLIQRQ